MPSTGSLKLHFPSPDAQSAMSSLRVGSSAAAAGRAMAAIIPSEAAERAASLPPLRMTREFNVIPCLSTCLVEPVVPVLI
ncbi:hypothetical protein GCM10010324_07300 [Streptomyces hiroshimensis]|uniref:Uncharacterized protein n=1 Tax=Streptomyces hiroshimensis TaxID=66424 RepID=A0ABQ2Y5E1_9ACTN|nr:hypothetical protein GCM10010324_07300 [Streptomyces hiroshimensis]